MIRFTSRLPRSLRFNYYLGRHAERPCFKPGMETLEDRCLLSASGLGDEVLRWNNVALNADVVDFTPGAGVPGAGLTVNGGPVKAARALAIVQIAIFDAVNAIDGSYKPYAYTATAPANSSIQAAIAQAGHDTLAALYPQQSASFDAALTQDLAAIPDGPSKTEGIATGAASAAAILAERANDGNGNSAPYTPNPNPGFWRPDPLHPTQVAYAPNYGLVTPFGIQNVDQFIPPPATPMDSPQYTAAYNEVRSLGGDGVITPTMRTSEQTDIGIFWSYDGSPGIGVPPRLYNQIAQTIAVQENNTEIQNARLFALVNIAMADAGIVSWNGKYIDNFWRPVTAIRESDLGTGATGLGDGNPDTVGDPTWTPFGATASNPQLSATGTMPTNFTPPFPAYTSGHATFGAALFQTLRDFYGTDNVTFTFTSDELNGVTKDQNGETRPLLPRTFTSFSQAAFENAESRIYLGIHWAFDRDQGLIQGKGVGNQVFDRIATPVTTPSEHVVNSMFEDLLARRVDRVGQAMAQGMLDKGANDTQVALALMNSDEFRRNAVEVIYFDMLNRLADAGGLAFFSQVMAQGGTEDQVRTMVAGSTEYSAGNAGFVDKVFQNMLGRAADQGAQQFFSAVLSQGMSRQQVASQVFNSTYYRTHFVDGVFQELLARTAVSTALDFFSGAMA